nr:transposase [Leucobacter coleopterorum]
MGCTGSYAAGLARFLTGHRVEAREVNAPHAHTRARIGKDDTIDAEAAARKVLAGVATAVPKRTDSVIESIRFLSLARDSAVKARTAAIVQLQDILVTAPANVRENTPTGGLAAVRHCRKFRIDRARLNDPVQAVKLALRALAVRAADLDTEIKELESALATLVHATAPTLVSRVGIGTIHAAQLLVTADENIVRFRSETAFARLCGVAPVPVSSGKSHREEPPHEAPPRR